MNNGLKVRLKYIGFMLGLVKDVPVWAHNIYNKYPEYSTQKICHTYKEVVEFAREMDSGLVRINGKEVEYIRIVPAIDWTDKFRIVVLFEEK